MCLVCPVFVCGCGEVYGEVWCVHLLAAAAPVAAPASPASASALSSSQHSASDLPAPASPAANSASAASAAAAAAPASPAPQLAQVEAASPLVESKEKSVPDPGALPGVCAVLCVWCLGVWVVYRFLRTSGFMCTCVCVRVVCVC